MLAKSISPVKVLELSHFQTFNPDKVSLYSVNSSFWVCQIFCRKNILDSSQSRYVSSHFTKNFFEPQINVWHSQILCTKCQKCQNIWMKNYHWSRTLSLFSCFSYLMKKLSWWETLIKKCQQISVSVYVTVCSYNPYIWSSQNNKYHFELWERINLSSVMKAPALFLTTQRGKK